MNDKLVYLPDDPRFTRFRSTFKNHVALMEERIPVGIKTADNTEEMIVKLLKDNNNHIDQKAVLRARLLDNFVMDFDRHEAQWKWEPADSQHSKIYYPLPKDRDQVFYASKGGILPKLIRSKNLFPELQGFKAKDKNVRTFNRAARNFDRTFLTEMSESHWKAAIDTFLSQMTDSVIEAALKNQPEEIRGYSAVDIIKTLKESKKLFIKIT